MIEIRIPRRPALTSVKYFAPNGGREIHDICGAERIYNLWVGKLGERAVKVEHPKASGKYHYIEQCRWQGKSEILVQLVEDVA